MDDDILNMLQDIEKLQVHIQSLQEYKDTVNVIIIMQIVYCLLLARRFYKTNGFSRIKQNQFTGYDMLLVLYVHSISKYFGFEMNHN